MIRLRELRTWTALLALALSTLALRQAPTVLSFGLAEALAQPQDAVQRLERFVGAPIVGARARIDLLKLAPGADSAQRIDQISDLLAQRPLDSAAWLDLAAARLAAGDRYDSIAASLALSSLTGPNEADLMAGRAALALPLWDRLPRDLRRSAMTDLVGGWASLDEASRAALKAAMAFASGATRAEIRAALLLSGKPGAAIETALGLTPDPAPAPNGPVAGDLATGFAPPPSDPAPATGRFLRGLSDR